MPVGNRVSLYFVRSFDSGSAFQTRTQGLAVGCDGEIFCFFSFGRPIQVISLFDDSVEVEGHDVGREREAGKRGSKPEFTFSHRVVSCFLLLLPVDAAGVALCVVRIVVYGKQR